MLSLKATVDNIYQKLKCVLFDPPIPLIGTYTGMFITHTMILIPMLYTGANIWK